MICISIPTHINLGRTSRSSVSLSRNVWDNMHWTRRTKAKHVIQHIVSAQVIGQKAIQGQFAYTCQMHLKTTAQDMDNFADVILKIVTDAVVALGWLPGDSCKQLLRGSREYAGKDSDNPRVVIRYYEI